MLRWQHKNGRNARIWMRFLLISALLHGVLLVGILFVYSDRVSHYALTMSATLTPAATVVVLAPSKGGTSANAVQSARQVAVSQPTTQIIKQIPPKKSPPVAKKAVKKKKKMAAPVQKKPVKKSPAVEKKKPKVPEKKAPELKKVEDTQIKKSVVPEQQKAANIPPSENSLAAVPPSDTIAIAYADARLVHQYTVLQQELSKHWAPPPGVGDDCMCQLTVCLDRAGVVEDVRIEQSSGVLIFDIAARSALLAMQWPVWALASSITITFKP